MVLVKYLCETILKVVFLMVAFVSVVKISALGIRLFVMISLVSEDNLSNCQVILMQVLANVFCVCKAG